MSYVLAIDQGTTSTRAMVYDAAGRCAGRAAEELTQYYPQPGWVEHNAEEIWQSVAAVVPRALAAAGVEPRSLAAIGLTNQRETSVLWERAGGRAVSRALVWQDRRTTEFCRQHEHDEAWIRGRTGLVLDPYFSAPKMAWLRANCTTAGVVTTTDSWIVHHLTGAFVTDAATASRSLLTDLDTVDWDPELVALFGLSGERLPDIVANDRVVGSTDAFGPSAPVGGLIVDQQAALLAQRCLSPGSAKCTFGTGVFLLVNVGAKAVRSSTGLTCSVAWDLRDTPSYCVDGQAYTAASAIRWITELGLIAAPTDLDSAAAHESDGTLFVPALAGLAAPWWRPDASASFSGMTLSTTRAQLVTAVIEGLATHTAELLSAIDGDLSAPLTTLRVDGGLSRSARLMQATADLTQIPIEVYPSGHATALGAAACARLATNPDLTAPEAIPAWTPATTYHPHWSPERAAEYRDRWRAAVSALLPEENIND